MIQNKYIWIIFIPLFALCGCAASQNSNAPLRFPEILGDLEYLPDFSYEEQLELRSLLERYIQGIDSSCDLNNERERQEDELFKMFSKETPDKDAPIILASGTLWSLRSIPQDTLGRIRANYESCLTEEKGLKVYLADTKKLTGLDYSSFWPVQIPEPFFSSPSSPLPRDGRRIEENALSVRASGYIHYVQEDGRERKVVAFTDTIAETGVYTKSAVEPDGKTITLNYFIRDSFTKEDSKPIGIKGCPIIEKYTKQSIRKFEWKGKASIPEGKTLVIEFCPTGDDLTEKERQYGCLVFIAREVG